MVGNRDFHFFFVMMEWRVGVVGPAARECLNLLIDGGENIRDEAIFDSPDIELQIAVAPTIDDADTVVVAFSNPDPNLSDHELRNMFLNCHPPDTQHTVVAWYMRPAHDELVIMNQILRVWSQQQHAKDCYLWDTIFCPNDSAAARSQLARHISQVRHIKFK